MSSGKWPEDLSNLDLSFYFLYFWGDGGYMNSFDDVWTLPCPKAFLPHAHTRVCLCKPTRWRHWLWLPIQRRPRYLNELSSDHLSSEYGEEGDNNAEIDNVLIALKEPNQPILSSYNLKWDRRPTTNRYFKQEWFKVHSWLSCNIELKWDTCFSCKKSFSFSNWKKPNHFVKHANSGWHRRAIMKWVEYKSSSYICVNTTG